MGERKKVECHILASVFFTAITSLRSLVLPLGVPYLILIKVPIL